MVGVVVVGVLVGVVLMIVVGVVVGLGSCVLSVVFFCVSLCNRLVVRCRLLVGFLFFEVFLVMGGFGSVCWCDVLGYFCD